MKIGTPKGLYAKYEVKRTDGRDAEGQKHHGCWHFVIDVTHDPAARGTLLAYSHLTDNEDLRRDLYDLIFRGQTVAQSAMLRPDAAPESGEDAYIYWRDGRPYVVLPRDNETVQVIDLDAGRWYEITWTQRSYDDDFLVPSCTCGELLWDGTEKRTTQKCVHWSVWHDYFIEYVYEPPE